MFYLAWSDYLERTRRSSFLIILGLTVVAGYFYLPANSSTTSTLAFTLDFSGYRGVYNSAWVGTQVALFASLWLSLIGFYLVKNTVERDVSTGVGQIIATTSVRKAQYTLGKMLSNFAMLATMVVVLAIAAGVMQLVRGEDTHIDLLALLSPFVLIMLPTMAVVAAFAILFETVSWLSRTLGNIVYFLLIGGIITVTASINIAPTADLFSSNFPIQQMQQGVQAAVPGYNGTFNYGTRFGTIFLRTFRWSGMQWSGEIVLSRLLWVGVAIAIALLAALFFKRFDAVHDRQSRRVKLFLRSVSPATDQEISVSVPAGACLTPLAGRRGAWRWATLLASEMRLLLKGVVWWWFIGAATFIALCLFLPVNITLGSLFPVAWLWALPLWSALGNRETRYQTRQLIFSTAHPIARQLSIQWLAGIVIALLTASGMIAHFILISDWSGLLALGVGAIFVPALALATGVWTGNSRLFEIAFVTFWYIGVINHLPVLDFMGANASTLAMHIPLAYGIAAIALLLLAFAGRWQQLQG